MPTSSWSTADDSNYYPTYDCGGQSGCGVGNNGGYERWDQYQTWEIPQVGSRAAQAVRVQFVYRPINHNFPNPEEDPNPYLTIEVFQQRENFVRDGWGCAVEGDNESWWSDDTWDEPEYAYPVWLDDVESTQGCGGGYPIDSELEYQLTLRTAEETVTPLFTAGYLENMATALTRDAGISAYTMTISGAPREWQWVGGPNDRGDFPGESDDSYSYANYFDATNQDWSFSTYDSRTIASQSGNPAEVEECAGLGMAAMSSNGNGGSMPRWDAGRQTLLYGTQGKHYMPANIDDSNSPTSPTSAGLVYIGRAEMVIPNPLAQCMWASAGLSTQEDLEKLAGVVLAPSQDGPTLKDGAGITVTVDDTAVYIDASGYTYSAADLSVAPAVGLSRSAINFEPATLGSYSEAFIEVTNNTDDTFGVSDLSISGLNAADFAVVGTDCPLELQPLATCGVALEFVPLSLGAREAELEIITAPNLAGPYAVQLWGYAEPRPTNPPAPMPASAPVNVAASPGNASATVSWSPPTSTGSFVVSSYEVKSSPGGVTCISASTECVVTDLTNGTSYTFVVRALTGAGWGAYSAASNAVVPRGEDPPPAQKSILITGSREGRIVSVLGQSTGLTDSSVTPFVRLRGAAIFTQGAGTRPIDRDGAFNWQRSTGKRLSVYFTGSGAKSNTVTIEGR